MRPIGSLFISVVAFALVQPVWAGGNPWLGRWQLNPGKSTLTGQTYTAHKIPHGYHFDYGAVKYDLLEDGKDHPSVGNYTAALTLVGKNLWLLINKVNGKETSRITLRLSADGKTLHEDIAGNHADGSSYTEHLISTRVGPGQGLAGNWKEVRAVLPDKAIRIYSDAGGGKLKAETPATREVIVASLDGTPAPVTGPRAVPGETFAVTKTSDLETKYTVAEQGKPYIEGTETVTPDGKVLRDVYWLVVKPSEKTTEIWEKQ